MSGPFGSSSFNHLVSSGFYNGVIDQSLRFNKGDGAELTRTPSGASNRKTWTVSTWVKFGDVSGDSAGGVLLGAFASSYSDFIKFDTSNRLQISFGNAHTIGTVPLFRDPTNWFHVVVAVDVTESTDTDRVKIYINGTQQTLQVIYSSYPSNTNYAWNNTVIHTVGGLANFSGYQFDGYLAEFNFIDGSALTPSSFGETKNDVWIPKKLENLTYGTNGFRLTFADSSSLGDDTSGNGNDYSPTSGLTSVDVVPDRPENNFPTVNDLEEYGTTVSEGNLKFTTGTSTAPALATFSIPTSGKWYWEVYVVTVSDMMIGVQNRENVQSAGYSGRKTAYYRQGGSGGGSGSIYIEGTGNGGDQSAYGNGDVVAVVYNADDMKISWRVNGTQEGNEFDVTDTDVAPIIYQASGSGSCSGIFNFGQDDTFAGALSAGNNADAKGIGNFKYAPPSGYLALCSANLPNPTIGPNSATQADDHFNTVLYTGDGTSSNAITGVGFQPDWVWIKSRDEGTSSYTGHHVTQDSTRGVGTNTALVISENYSEATTGYSNGITSFDSDGFTLGARNQFNYNTDSYVAWNWKANGGTTSSNATGTTTSTVQANTTAGFSIISYAGNASSRTIGHGLSQAPEWVIAKSRTDDERWVVFHTSVSNGYIYLDDSFSLQTGNADERFGDSSSIVVPSSTLITMGANNSDINESGDDYIMFAFHPVDGYSRFGTYTGNGNANGPFVYTNFRPALVIIKQTNSTNNWRIVDNKREGYNGDTEVMYPSVSNAAGSEVGPDILSNGFKLRADTAGTNANSGTFIYMAFAEQPFKFSNAR